MLTWTQTCPAPSMTRSRYFVPVIFFLVAWTLTTHGKYSVTGDEPHYLIVSQSLLSDWDLDLRNNHAEHQEVKFGAAALEPGPHAQVDRGGRLMPVHDIGVPVLLLPVYAAAVTVADWPPEGLLLRFRMSRGLFAYSILSLFLIAVAALAAAITKAALQDQGLSDGLASVVVLTLWLAPPVLSNSFVVFPEVFALLITAYAVRLSARYRSDFGPGVRSRGARHGHAAMASPQVRAVRTVVVRGRGLEAAGRAASTEPACMVPCRRRAEHPKRGARGLDVVPLALARRPSRTGWPTVLVDGPEGRVVGPSRRS